MISQLFEHFNTYEVLPIHPNDVRDQLVGMGVQDRITFHYVTIEERILRGVLYKYRKRVGVYAESLLCSEICIAESLDYDWKRLVAVKELLHIVDTNNFTAQSREAVEALIKNFSFPDEIRNFSNSYLNDRVQLLLALAILIPVECRRSYRRQIDTGKMTHEEIAAQSEVPVKFIEPILSSLFEEWIADLISD